MPTETATTVATLKASLASVAPAIAPKTQRINALRCVRIGEGRVQATDMSALIDAPMTGVDIAPTLVLASDLKKILGALKAGDSVSFESVDDGIVVVSPRGRTILPTHDIADWPAWVDADRLARTFAPDDGKAFGDLLRSVAAFESGDESRKILCSTFLQVDATVADDGTSWVEAISCDSYRMALDSLRGTGDSMFACAPMSSYLARLARIDRVQSTVESAERGSSGQYLFDAPAGAPDIVAMHDDSADVHVYVRMVVGSTPGYHSLIPKSPEYVVDLPCDLLDSVNYMRKVCKGEKDRVVPVKLAFDADELVASMSVQDGASHESAFELPGDVDPDLVMQYGVSPDYLADGLAFVGEDATADLVSPLHPMLLGSRSAGIDRRYLVMPVRLPE